MERAAEVGFSCTGGGGAVRLIWCRTPASLCPRPNFLHRNEQENRRCSLRTICLQAQPDYSELPPPHQKKQSFFYMQNLLMTLSAGKVLFAYLTSVVNHRGDGIKPKKSTFKVQSQSGGRLKINKTVSRLKKGENSRSN